MLVQNSEKEQQSWKLKKDNLNDQNRFFTKKQPVFVLTKYKRTKKTSQINFFASHSPVKLKISHKHQKIKKKY